MVLRVVNRNFGDQQMTQNIGILTTSYTASVINVYRCRFRGRFFHSDVLPLIKYIWCYVTVQYNRYSMHVNSWEIHACGNFTGIMQRHIPINNT